MNNDEGGKSRGKNLKCLEDGKDDDGDNDGEDKCEVDS